MRGVPRRILHPTDFSPASRPAFDRAVALARRPGAQLIVLHVMVPPSPFTRAGRPPEGWEELESRARRRARLLLAAIVARARRRGTRVRGRLVEGVPWAEIAGAARRVGADVIVIGTHGRTGVKRFLLGSVAERVLAAAPCPVLSVRGRRQ
jgi:nucleotide-binding universal stress UspA family protein